MEKIEKKLNHLYDILNHMGHKESENINLIIKESFLGIKIDPFKKIRKNKKLVSIGSTGPLVEEIQNLLVEKGHPLPEYGIDGIFGEETKQAVRDFQTKESIRVDGIVGPETIGKLSPVDEGISIKEDKIKIIPRAVKKFEKGGPLTNIDATGKRVDLENSTQQLKDFVKILDAVARNNNKKFKITSAYRDDYNQARIMYNNYNKRSMAEGKEFANKYLKDLYSKLPKIGEIVAIYEREDIKRKDKIRKAEAIISQNWGAWGHRAGKSIDVSGLTKADFDAILEEAKERGASFKTLWEGDHYHLTVV